MKLRGFAIVVSIRRVGIIAISVILAAITSAPWAVGGGPGAMGASDADSVSPDHGPRMGVPAVESVWIHRDQPDFELSPGDIRDGFEMRFDTSAGFEHERRFPAHPIIATRPRVAEETSLHVYRSPDNRTALVIIWDLDKGGIRGGLLDLHNKRLVTNQLIPDTQTLWGVGSGDEKRFMYRGVAWSPDSRFVAVQNTNRLWESDLALIDVVTGFQRIHRPTDLMSNHLPSPLLESIRWLRDDVVQATFDVNVVPEPCIGADCYPIAGFSLAENIDLAATAAPCRTHLGSDASTAVLLIPGESCGGVTFGSHGKISAGGTKLFQERLSGVTNFDYFYLRVYEAPDGIRIVELYHVAEDLSVNTNSPLLASATVFPEGVVLSQDALAPIPPFGAPVDNAGINVVLNYLSGIAAFKDEMDFIRQSDFLFAPSAKYAIPWVEVLGTLSYMNDASQHIRNKQYNKAFEVTLFYLNHNLITQSLTAKNLMGFAPFSKLAAMPVVITIKDFASLVDSRGFENQHEAYVRCRASGISHQLMMRGEDAHIGRFAVYFLQGTSERWIYALDEEGRLKVVPAFGRKPLTVSRNDAFELFELSYLVNQTPNSVGTGLNPAIEEFQLALTNKRKSSY